MIETKPAYDGQTAAKDYRIGRYQAHGAEPQYHWADIEAAFLAGAQWKNDRLAEAVPADPEIAPRHWDVHALDTVMKRLSQIGKVVDRIAVQAEANMNLLEAVHGAVAGDKSHPIGEEWLNEDPQDTDPMAKAMQDLGAYGFTVNRIEPKDFYLSPRSPDKLVTGLDVANAPDETKLVIRDGNKWGIIPDPEGAGRLMDFIEFQGRLYVSYEKGIYVLDGTELKPMWFVAE